MPALRPQLTLPYRHLLAIDTSTDVLSLALAISDGTANVSAWAITTPSTHTMTARRPRFKNEVGGR